MPNRLSRMCKWTMQLYAEKWERVSILGPEWWGTCEALAVFCSGRLPFLHLTWSVYSSGSLIIGVTSGHRQLGLFCFHEVISYSNLELFPLFLGKSRILAEGSRSGSAVHISVLSKRRHSYIFNSMPKPGKILSSHLCICLCVLNWGSRGWKWQHIEGILYFVF